MSSSERIFVAGPPHPWKWYKEFSIISISIVVSSVLVVLLDDTKLLVAGPPHPWTRSLVSSVLVLVLSLILVRNSPHACLAYY